MPATTAPRATQTPISVMMVARRASGANSAVSADALLWQTPSPTPTSSRHSPSCQGAVAVVAPREATRMIISPPSSSGRRPNRSPSGAMNADPTPRPSTEAASAMPNAAGTSRQYRASVGTARAMACRS